MPKAFRTWTGLSIFSVVTLLSSTVLADSFQGTLPDPTFTVQQTFTIGTTSNVTVQTWGFGGGVNAAGNTIAPGGFDALIALFNGMGNSATIVLDALGNEAAGADNLVGNVLGVANCPPAGTVVIGGSPVCGDVKFTAFGLAAGTYTVLLSDANYVPQAVNPGPPFASTIGDGFADLTGGVFQTCTDASDCITPNGNYAFDILATPASQVPEPGTLALVGGGLIACLRKRK